MKTVLWTSLFLGMLGACNATNRNQLDRVIVNHEGLAISTTDEDTAALSAYKSAKTFFAYVTQPSKWNEDTQKHEQEFFTLYDKFRTNCQFEVFLTYLESDSNLGHHLFNVDFRAKVLNQPTQDRSVLTISTARRFRTPTEVRWTDKVHGHPNYRLYEEAQFQLSSVMKRLKQRQSSCFSQ